MKIIAPALVALSILATPVMAGQGKLGVKLPTPSNGIAGCWNSERNLYRPAGNCPGGCRRWRRSLSLHHDRRESRTARDGGALTTDGSPLRIAPPAEQLLRRQSMSPGDCRNFVPALVALRSPRESPPSAPTSKRASVRTR